QQINYQSVNKPDFFIAETIEYLGEALIALEAIKDAGYEAMITLGFKYDTMTLDGVEMTEAFKRIEAEGAEIVGLNCFRDPDRMLPLAKEVREAVKCHVATQPVAYKCSDDKPYFQIQMVGDHPAFPLELDSFTLSRIEMAEYAVKARDIGINFIGSCCGSGPHHVRAMAEALGRTPRGSRYSPKLEVHPIIGNETHVREQDSRILCEQKYGKAHCHFMPKEEE
ncbi:homocysteine S-methyltransferase family protein, partial [Nitrospirota bacterium]